MLGVTIPPREHRRRYRQLTGTLARHGMGALGSRLGLNWRPFRLAGTPDQDNLLPNSPAEHLRVALEELGTTAIKLGQILSTRSDLVSPEIALELSKLRTQVPPAPSEEIMAILECELGQPIASVFRDFVPSPLASASIGQVYAATLPNGADVIVKVRKPGVKEQVNNDLEILEVLASRAADSDLLDGYDIEALAQEFAVTLRAELDYMTEGQNADRLREVLAGEPRAVVPHVYWEYTTESVLVMERLHGQHPDELSQEAIGDGFGHEVAIASAEILFTQIFDAGLFHADPHPGNIIVLTDGRIGYCDFGMVGQLTEQTQLSLLRLLNAAMHGDGGSVTDCLDDLGAIKSASDREGIRREIQPLLERYYGIPLEQFTISEYIADIQAMMRRHRLQLPTDLALVLKTFVMSEGLWRDMDPSFNVAAVAEPHLRQAMAKALSPVSMGKRIAQASGDALEAATELPGQIRRIARRIDRGEFEIALRHRDMDETVERASAMVSRLSTAIVIAALILSAAIVSTSYRLPAWHVLGPIWLFGSLILAGFFAIRLFMAEHGRH